MQGILDAFLTVEGSSLVLWTGLSGADPVPLVLDGVDLHPDPPTLFHPAMAALIPLVLVDNAAPLKSAAKWEALIEIVTKNIEIVAIIIETVA